MDFADFVKKRYRDEHDAVPRGALQRLGKTLDHTGSLQSLIESGDPVLDPFSTENLARLSDAYRAYLDWKEGAKSLRRSLAEAGLSLPDGSRDIAVRPDELRAC